MVKNSDFVALYDFFEKNKFTVLNDSAVASGDTAIGYFYCKSISNGQTFGGTFKIRISPNGKITFP